MMKLSRRLAGAVAVAGLGLLVSRAPAAAATRTEIDAQADAALARLHAENPAAKALAEGAKAVLVFPNVVKAGFGLGGEYGEGVLRRGGEALGYYSLVSASFGFQIGAQSYAQALFFMSEEALAWLERSRGFELGADASVAVAGSGAGGELDSSTLSQPIIAFVFGQQGLMANATIEGSKISRIER
jgi:lipid-binding SYLF domain-containing protein